LGLLGIVLAIASKSAFGQEAAPLYVIHAKDGPLPGAALHRLQPNWALERAGGGEMLKGMDWISLQQQGHVRPAPPTNEMIVLGNGDRVRFKPGQPVRLEDGRLYFTPTGPLRPATGKELSLYRPFIALVLLAIPENVDDPELFVIRLQRELHERDVVLLRNGDRIEGSVDSLNDKQGCTMVADGQKIVTPWSRLAGVAFATTTLGRPQPRKLHAVAVLAGGDRVRFGSLRYDAVETQWTGRTTTGTDVCISGDGLIALDLLQGRAVYLSEMPPLGGFKSTPYMDLRWPLGPNSALDGRALQVGEYYFDKGVSLHARSQASYWLDGHFSWFEATVGLDPTVGTRGRARLALVVDGKRYPIADGRELTVNDPPHPVRLDVRTARSLTLVVDFGSLGDVQSRVNWGAARLIRTRP
jgi:hypothetical protein